jgi:hypothetical protein
MDLHVHSASASRGILLSAILMKENLVHQVGGMRVNQLVCDFDEPPERAVEVSVADTAAGNEHRGDGRGRIEG